MRSNTNLNSAVTPGICAAQLSLIFKKLNVVTQAELNFHYNGLNNFNKGQFKCKTAESTKDQINAVNQLTQYGHY